MRPFWIASNVWLGLIAIASVLGGLMSLYTGPTSQLPKWNGWDYFLFCANEGAAMGAILTLPVAIIVYLVAWASYRDRHSA